MELMVIRHKNMLAQIITRCRAGKSNVKHDYAHK